MIYNWDEYKENIKKALDNFYFDSEIPQILKQARNNNSLIFVAGNGGSAGLADHYVCDLSKGANKDWQENKKRFKSICLSTNTGYITAIANDTSYDEIFKQQLVNLAHPNDVIILISSSGNSPNIINALNYAKEIGMKTISVTGLTGGKLKQLADYHAHVNTELYETAEDIAAIFGHFIAWHLRNTAD